MFNYVFTFERIDVCGGKREIVITGQEESDAFIAAAVQAARFMPYSTKSITMVKKHRVEITVTPIQE